MNIPRKSIDIISLSNYGEVSYKQIKTANNINIDHKSKESLNGLFNIKDEYISLPTINFFYGNDNDINVMEKTASIDKKVKQNQKNSVNNKNSLLLQISVILWFLVINSN